MSDSTMPHAVPSDDDLVGMLAEALRRIEPMPEHVADGVRAALAWRDVDAELAELSFDSLMAASGARGDGADRQLTFRAGDVEIEVTVADGDPDGRLLGQLVPPGAFRVELMAGGGYAETVADDAGRFMFDGPFSGPACLVVHRADTQIRTDWVVL